MPRPPRCPTCGTQTLRIVYGMPSRELWEQAERGEVMLGGCEPEMPDWWCPSCEAALPVPELGDGLPGLVPGG